MALHLIVAQNLALYCLQCKLLLLALHPLRSMHLAVSLFARRPGPFFREIKTVQCVEQRSILGLARRCFLQHRTSVPASSVTSPTHDQSCRVISCVLFAFWSDPALQLL